VQLLEGLAEFRSRLRGKFTTRNLDSFATYSNLRAVEHPLGNTQAFIDTLKMECSAIFNIGNAQHPGQCDDNASLTLDACVEFAAILKLNGNKLSQKQLAEWLDDWNYVLAPFYGEEIEGDDPGIELGGTSLRRAIRAVRNIEIKEGTATVTKVGNMINSASALSSIEARSDHEMPSGFYATIIPYDGFRARAIRLDLSVGTDSPPRLQMRIARLEALSDSIAREFVDLIHAGCPTLTPIIGRYAPV
jgi:uncharacterized protein YfdQ (DUF2303 family)